MNCTEHKKLENVKGQSQAIGEFLDWLAIGKGFTICKLGEYEFFPVRMTSEILLAEYFSIDLTVLEKEKRHMLNEQRKRTEKEK